MNDLERHEDCIIDNVNCKVISLKSSTVHHFDFLNMTYQIGDLKTLKPIRFISETKTIRYWGRTNWMRIREVNLSKAVAKLFDNYHERELLGLNNAVKGDDVCPF